MWGDYPIRIVTALSGELYTRDGSPTLPEGIIGNIAERIKINSNMNSERTYTYNVVLQENDVCPRGELLTDKELERMKLHNPKRDWPKTAKAKVYAESCYISFGVRFGRVKQYLNTGK